MKKAVLALVPVALSIPGLVNTAKGQNEPIFTSGAAQSTHHGWWSSYYINQDQGFTAVGYDGSIGPVDAETFIEWIGNTYAGPLGYYQGQSRQAEIANWYGASGVFAALYWDTLPEYPGGYWQIWPLYEPNYSPVTMGYSGINSYPFSAVYGSGWAYVNAGPSPVR